MVLCQKLNYETTGILSLQVTVGNDQRQVFITTITAKGKNGISHDQHFVNSATLSHFHPPLSWQCSLLPEMMLSPSWIWHFGTPRTNPRIISLSRWRMDGW